jgi:hypothetical protein
LVIPPGCSLLCSSWELHKCERHCAAQLSVRWVHEDGESASVDAIEQGLTKFSRMCTTRRAMCLYRTTKRSPSVGKP